MGNCCDTSKPDPAAEKKFEKGGDNDISEGPLKQRRCTDILCLLLIIGNVVGYFIATFAYAGQGNITKLWKPRDYSGAYCAVGSSSQWNGGPDLTNFGSQTWMMNVSASVSVIMEQLVCSSAAANVLVYNSPPILPTSDLQNRYLCACCLSPCASCQGSLNVGGDLSSISSISSVISGRMNDLLNVGSSANVADLWAPSGANGDFFTNIWNQATQFFVAVCSSSCSLDNTQLNASDARKYVYNPAADDPLAFAWTALVTSALTPSSISSTINSSFTLSAFPSRICPYPASKCVPMPGLTPAAVGQSGYCDFTMSSAAVSAIGGSAASAFNALGGNNFQNTVVEQFGTWVGDFTRTIDTFCITAVVSFAVGLAFLVILRFTVGICVWLALLIGLILFVFVGALCYIRSGQCANTSFGAAANQQLVAVAVAASSSTTNLLTGQSHNEAISGDGSGYIGVQYHTISGHTCQTWGTSSPHAQAAHYTTGNYSNSNLQSNFCRNPYLASDPNKASTIWCFTTDTNTVWETCTPIGVIQPVCTYGYAVASDQMRMTLKVVAIFFWCLAIIYVLLVLCLLSRIRLAIALNKVAAMFVAHNPLVLLIPVVESILACLWVGLWAASAGYLLSEVPPSYTPTDSYATYAQAAGTSTTAGACNDKWPTGYAWKDEDACFGQSNSTAKCWKCYPPRYVFDVRFCYSLFSFFWNNEFLLAFAQLVLAGSVGVWFFTPNDQKGRKRVIGQSIFNACRYHLGTVAFGALIIATVKLIRWICFYFQKQAEAQKNYIMALILKVVQCIIWCFEKCLKFLNKNAYIQTALLGTTFCTSAKNAFFLIARNILRFGTVTFLSNIVHAIGFFFICASSSVAGYFILQAMHPNTSPIIPVVVYIIMSYIVAALYMNVFGMAVDTSLQCVIAAEEMGSDLNFVPGPLTSVLK